MIEAWRIVRFERAAGAFTGEGAAKFGGRWNSRGVPVVYTSESRALAALETLAHLNPPMLFRYKIFRIEFETSEVEWVGGRLPRDWREEPPPRSTRRIGDRWARTKKAPVLAVPSAIIPEEFNFLLNPLHSRFNGLKIGKAKSFVFDARLMN